ncbi:hypothetical protein ABK040_002512 [Willaertia magna]
MNINNQNPIQTSQNYFTSQFTKQLIQNNYKNENIIYSPLSIYLSLLIILFGAKGDTFDEISKTLQLNNNNILESQTLQKNTHIQSYLQNFNFLFNQTNDKKFTISNNLFIDQSLSLKQEFIDNILQSFHSPFITKCNFKENLQFEINKINKQIELKTNNLIKNLITKEIVNNLTKLLILNIIYFSDQWKYPFYTENTILNHNFNTLQKSKNTVTMMTKEQPDENYFYGIDDKYHWLNLFYENDNFVMTFISPTNKVKLSKESEFEFNEWFIDKLNRSDVSSYFLNNSMNCIMEMIKIPKFKLDFQTELTNTLQNEPFNMKTPFTSFADFSGMLHNENIKISNIIHKSVIQVNEIGTKAAAVTFLDAYGTILKIKYPSFILDRPFRFILHNRKSKDVLFVGIVNEAPTFD